MPTRQGGAQEASKNVRATTRHRKATGKHIYGLHLFLPKVGNLGSIIVVVDRFSKYATFIAAPTNCTAQEIAKLFVRHVVKCWGIPENIVSDRDPHFTG